ncbi:unnamed protein product [Symbiodinium necroappetens]|uniref:Uncharacterized protein n=1 Tax=Symbiodinium necroappetens TaxID=1628268 RepID=A0A812V4C5_9DINO|nr:unnamed protein product [Symbiodinium necroappetens]
MGRGLPNHLASLLRHHAPEKPSEEQVKAKETGRAARRRAARSKRKIKKAERHSQEQEKRRARKAERAEKLVAQEDVQPPVQTAEVTSEVKTKRQGKSKAVKQVQPKKPGNAAKASGVETLFDPEGAARDEALLRKLEKNLGIARDPSKRKKEERRIFEALGFDAFDAADAGMEELSSDEQGPEEVTSSHGPAPAHRLPAEGDSSADAMASLLETILGGKSSATDAGPKRKRRVAKSLKMARST